MRILIYRSLFLLPPLILWKGLLKYLAEKGGPINLIEDIGVRHGEIGDYEILTVITFNLF